MEGRKLDSQPPLASAAVGPKTSTSSVCDKLSGNLFLIDSGAEVSLLPPSAANRTRGDSGRPLNAVNSSKVKSYGQRTVTVQLHGHSFSWEFTIADTNCHLLGADYLRANSLLPNLTTPGLFSATQGYIIPFQCSTANVRVFQATTS